MSEQMSPSLRSTETSETQPHWCLNLQEKASKEKWDELQIQLATEIFHGQFLTYVEKDEVHRHGFGGNDLSGYRVGSYTDRQRYHIIGNTQVPPEQLAFVKKIAIEVGRKWLERTDATKEAQRRAISEQTCTIIIQGVDSKTKRPEIFNKTGKGSEVFNLARQTLFNNTPKRGFWISVSAVHQDGRPYKYSSAKPHEDLNRTSSLSFLQEKSCDSNLADPGLVREKFIEIREEESKRVQNGEGFSSSKLAKDTEKSTSPITSNSPGISNADTSQHQVGASQKLSFSGKPHEESSSPNDSPAVPASESRLRELTKKFGNAPSQSNKK